LLPPFSHQFGEIVLLRTCQETLDLLPQPASLWAPGVVCLLLMQIIMVIIMIGLIVMSMFAFASISAYHHYYQYDDENISEADDYVCC